MEKGNSKAMGGKISIRGARQNNLKNLNLEIEKNKLTVITGLSGSGKSSLAFDTIYAEGQRRFIDSLSTYARNFLMQLNKPDVDTINGLCPSIAIDQKTTGHSPRSTVGTVTEIYDYLRLLYAKVGRPHCPIHQIPVEGQALDQINSDILNSYTNEKLIFLAPMARGKKGEFKKEMETWVKAGYLMAKIDGAWVYLDQVEKLKKTRPHDIDLVVDKIHLKASPVKADRPSKPQAQNPAQAMAQRVAQAVARAVALTEGLLTLETKAGTKKNFSTRLACPECGYSFTNIDPLLFSFNNPKGACPDCKGLGTQDIYEYESSELVSGGGQSKSFEYELDSENPDMEWKDVVACQACQGSGLKETALNVFFEGKTIFDLSQMSISSLSSFFSTLKTKQDPHEEVLSQIIPEIQSRIHYLEKVGAGYLSLNRRSKTLSGGEAQRIRLASQVGTPLVGVLYVLDEPSIGLHPRDHKNILSVLEEIKQRGNTVIVVEHDEETIRCADHIIDIGPQAGRLGGELIFHGPYNRLKKSKGLTGDYVAGRKSIPVPGQRRKGG